MTTRDRQLQTVTLESVVEKRRLGQALNAKEFAVLVGISYSAAREWFRTPGFPVFRNRVFWQDFADWRRSQSGLDSGRVEPKESATSRPLMEGRLRIEDLPPRAARILLESD
jgi:hypothetical protein